MHFLVRIRICASVWDCSIRFVLLAGIMWQCDSGYPAEYCKSNVVSAVMNYFNQRETRSELRPNADSQVLGMMRTFFMRNSWKTLCYL